MKVVISVPSLAREFGGPTAKAFRLSAELRALGLDVRLVGAARGEQTAGEAVALPVRSRFHGTPIPGDMRRVARVVRGADVVHVLGYRDPIGTLACVAARRLGVPYVVEPVGMHRRRLRSLRLKRAFDLAVGDRLLDGAAATIATSQLEADELSEDGLDPAHIKIRPNGVDADAIWPLPERGAFRSAHGVPAGVPLVLSLGRIARKKGLVTFVDALSRSPDVWGAIVGPDDGDGALDDVRRALARRRMSRVVVVPHGLWGADKAGAFADADAFCLPSATENFGNAPAEAAAVGLPVVVSRASGVAEFLDVAATAVVDHDDPADVARGIARVTTPEAREAAAVAAYGVRERLSWPRMAVRQVEIYRSVAAPTGSAPDAARPAPRVLLTVPSLRREFGGPAVQASPFARALERRGFAVAIAACEAGELPGSVDLRRLGSFHSTPLPATVAPLARAVRAADVVHVMGFRDPVGTLAALRTRTPLVVEPMGMHRRRVRSVRIKTLFDRSFGRLVMRRADVVIATSALEREELTDDGVAWQRILVRPSGIDVDGATSAGPGRFRADRGIPEEAPLVLFLGRITEKKGLPQLVRAVARMPGCWLAIVGPDDRDGTLQRVVLEIDRAGVRDRVVIVSDGLWGPERNVAMRAADVFCLPSATENFGIAPAEAAGLGVPVVVSDRCGVAEFLPGDAHAVVPHGDVEALTAAIADGLRPVRKEAAARAAPLVRERLSWDAVAAEQAAIYERLLR